MVYNATSGFNIPVLADSVAVRPARLIFVTEDGTIVGWFWLRSLELPWCGPLALLGISAVGAVHAAVDLDHCSLATPPLPPALRGCRAPVQPAPPPVGPSSDAAPDPGPTTRQTVAYSFGLSTPRRLVKREIVLVRRRTSLKTLSMGLVARTVLWKCSGTLKNSSISSMSASRQATALGSSRSSALKLSVRRFLSVKWPFALWKSGLHGVLAHMQAQIASAKHIYFIETASNPPETISKKESLPLIAELRLVPLK